MEKIVDLLVYSGVSITLFLILLLSRNWKKQPSKIMLAGILLNFLLVFLLMVFLETDSGKGSFVLLPFVISVPFSWGPLLYFYIRSIYESELPFGWPFTKHFFLFFMVFFFITLPLFFHYAGLLLLPFSEGFLNIGILTAALGMLLLAFYIFRSFKLLHNYRRLIKEHYSSLSNIDLHWVSVWVKGFFILLLLDVLLPGIVLLAPGLGNIIYLEFFFFTAFIWYIGYYGIHQRQVFLPRYLVAAPEPEVTRKDSRQHSAALPLPPVEPNERTSLFKNENEANDVTARLQAVLAKEKLYKDPALNLRQLAEATGVSDKKLSELLNLHLETNFYEYVNGYRVAAFKEMIRSGRAKEYTLLALAFEAGFSSKASFNRIFKEHTRQTPSQYHKSIAKDIE